MRVSREMSSIRMHAPHCAPNGGRGQGVSRVCVWVPVPLPTIRPLPKNTRASALVNHVPPHVTRMVGTAANSVPLLGG